MHIWYGNNRLVCSVIEEMRATLKSMGGYQLAGKDGLFKKTSTYIHLTSLLEEMQTLANRMESALGDLKDLEGLHRDIKRLKKELKELEAKKEDKE